MSQRWMAALLAGAVLLGAAGCQTAPDRASDQAPRYEIVSSSEPENERPARAFESPAIESGIALHSDIVATYTAAGKSEEVRAVWISYLEMAHLLKNQSEKQFTANISTAFDNVKNYGLNTVIVQVRPFGDALYDSKYFPWSHTITGTEGKDPGFDPLTIMIVEAKKRGLRIEAWINPYRVRAQGNPTALSADNQAKKWLDSGKKSVSDYNGVISYNPASPDARKLIVNGIVEIVENYDVDGIHIDDYFYPTTDTAFDKAYYSEYKEKGGKLALDDWRRQNVEKLIKQIYTAVKKADANVLFGISPQSSVENNYGAQYLDVEKIAKTAGYCDYLCPQIYFGYQNDAQPYKKTLEQWNAMVKDSPVQLYVGIAAYKVGATDAWAGSGRDEWTQNRDLMKRQVADARKMDSYQGFVLYRYDSIFQPESAVKSAIQSENKNLKSIL